MVDATLVHVECDLLDQARTYLALASLYEELAHKVRSTRRRSAMCCARSRNDHVRRRAGRRVMRGAQRWRGRR